ncbi:MAG: hypothetical protein K2X36_00685 [Microbacteriaceae bacterium]|nr:hypothetical protein [Microbacteriaceae bacterium]
MSGAGSTTSGSGSGSGATGAGSSSTTTGASSTASFTLLLIPAISPTLTTIAMSHAIGPRMTPVSACPRRGVFLINAMAPSVMAASAGIHATKLRPGMTALTMATMPAIIAQRARAERGRGAEATSAVVAVRDFSTGVGAAGGGGASIGCSGVVGVSFMGFSLGGAPAQRRVVRAQSATALDRPGIRSVRQTSGDL